MAVFISHHTLMLQKHLRKTYTGSLHVNINKKIMLSLEEEDICFKSQYEAKAQAIDMEASGLPPALF